MEQSKYEYGPIYLSVLFVTRNGFDCPFYCLENDETVMPQAETVHPSIMNTNCKSSIFREQLLSGRLMHGQSEIEHRWSATGILYNTKFTHADVTVNEICVESVNK